MDRYYPYRNLDPDGVVKFDVVETSRGRRASPYSRVLNRQALHG